MGEPRDLIQSLKDLGIVARAQRDLAAARSLLEEAVARSRTAGDRPNLAVSLDRLGTVAHAEGRRDEARGLYAHSHALWRRLGDSSNLAWSLLNQGRLAMDEGDLPGAGALRKSLGLRRLDRHRPGLICLFEAFWALAWLEGQPLRVVQLAAAQQALRMASGLRRMPSHQADLNQALHSARWAVGDAAYGRAWLAGGALSLDGAIALALDGGCAGDLPPSRSATHAPPHPPAMRQQAGSSSRRACSAELGTCQAGAPQARAGAAGANRPAARPASRS